MSLRRNYRFAETGGIYQVSSAINTGEADAAIAALQKGTAKSDGRRCPKPAGLPARPARESRRRFSPISRNERSAGGARCSCSNSGFWAPCGQGPFGIENLNTIAEERLAEAGLLVPRRGWYRGRPIM